MTDVRPPSWSVALDAAAPTGGQTRTSSVLVVDDDVDHRTLISRRLGLSGARVATASSADEAMTRLHGVDVVLLDYRLGAEDGLSVLQQIVARPQPPAVVMVTGMGSEELAMACIRAGASDYVVKDRSYLASLPAVVDRAWRHHDLARRARQLERLALVVTSAPDRDVALHEIVEGARWLLAAERCELRLADVDLDGEPAPTSCAGEAIDPSVAAEELRVPVSLPETGRLGELVVQRTTSGPFTAEEARLATTFASFAAIAMAKLRQLELERSVVAELERTLDMRRQLVAGVSHELRTPLTAISGFAQTVLAHWQRLGETDVRDMIERIHANAKDLALLVEQLLDFAAMEAGRTYAEVQTIDVLSVLGDALGDLAPLIADRTTIVDVEPGLIATGDPSIVRRILFNLLSNAAKYTPADAAIAVRARSIGTDDRMLRVEVRDTGPGLSDADAARVFEPFWRAESTRDRRRGTGIGLALVRDYARVMGGEAGVETALGEGATFWFTLRKARDGSPALSPSGQAPSVGSV